jgi:ClpP class serine protease
MARNERAAAIAAIEELRGSKVITYVTGDRNPAQAQIGDDALRPIYEQLRDLGKPKKLDLFIYSRGGATDVPWRIANALRQTTADWNMLIPFRANSAATLLALGEEQIVLGRNGELGPIDPTLAVQRMASNPGGGQSPVQEQFPVEDIMAYVRFVQERGGISDQAAAAA